MNKQEADKMQGQFVYIRDGKTKHERNLACIEATEYLYSLVGEGGVEGGRKIRFLGYDFYMTKDKTYFELPKKQEAEIAKRMIEEYVKDQTVFLETPNETLLKKKGLLTYYRWLDKEE